MNIFQTILEKARPLDQRLQMCHSLIGRFLEINMFNRLLKYYLRLQCKLKVRTLMYQLKTIKTIRTASKNVKAVTLITVRAEEIFSMII